MRLGPAHCLTALAALGVSPLWGQDPAATDATTGITTGDLEEDESDHDSERVFVELVPSKHVKIGRMALNTLIQTIQESVDKAVDDFWQFHSNFPMLASNSLPNFPRRDYFSPTDKLTFERLKSTYPRFQQLPDTPLGRRSSRVNYGPSMTGMEDMPRFQQVRPPGEVNARSAAGLPLVPAMRMLAEAPPRQRSEGERTSTAVDGNSTLLDGQKVLSDAATAELLEAGVAVGLGLPLVSSEEGKNGSQLAEMTAWMNPAGLIDSVLDNSEEVQRALDKVLRSLEEAIFPEGNKKANRSPREDGPLHPPLVW